MATKPQVKHLGVYAYLIDHCLHLRAGTAADIERYWQMTAEAAYEAGARSCPTDVENIIACGACREVFGDEVLRTVPGFCQFDRVGTRCNCLEWRNNCVCHLKIWKLDIDPRLAARGIVILRHDSLLILRHARDVRPFRLRLREAAA